MEKGDEPVSLPAQPVREQPAPEQPAPAEAGLLIDVGRQRRKHVNRLMQGEGRLAREVQAALYNAREELGIDSAAEIIPVVLLYRYEKSEYAVIGPQA